MIRDEDGNRISAKRMAKEIILEYLDSALIDFWQRVRPERFKGMTDLEMVKLDDALQDLAGAIMRRHNLRGEANGEIKMAVVRSMRSEV